MSVGSAPRNLMEALRCINDWAQYLLKFEDHLGIYQRDDRLYFRDVGQHSPKVLWDLFQDTLSIPRSYLLRPAQQYHTSAGKALSKADWILNRFRLLRQLEIMTAVVSNLGLIVLMAMVRDATFLDRVVFLKSRVLGGIRAGELLKIVRPTNRSITYFIINRRLQEAKWLADAEDSWFESLSASMTEKWPRAGPLLENSGSALKKAGHLLAAIPVLSILTNLSIPVGHGGSDLISLVSHVTKISATVLKQRLYGGDEWMEIALGDALTIVHQKFRKNKNYRDSI